MQQLRCRDLEPGDLMLKVNDGSKIARFIRYRQKGDKVPNEDIVHAGIMYDPVYIIEAQRVGMNANDLRVQNAHVGYFVYRPQHPKIAAGAAECAKLMHDIQSQHQNMSYNLMGALRSTGRGGGGGSPSSPQSMDALLTKILQGKGHSFFCSQFVVYVYQFVAEQCGIGAGALFNVSDAKMPPGRLAAMLEDSGQFEPVGYMMPHER